MRLLAVEGNNSLPDSHLCDDQNVVVRAATPDEALSILRHDTVDVVVIDVASLADRGFGFIRQVRAARDDTPIVALTGQQAADRIRALGLGADDAITQPVDPPELRARIAAVVRRSQGLSQSVAVAGDLSLFLSAREVLYGGVPVHLTAKEYAVLELLVVRKGQIITKDDGSAAPAPPT
jgi:two-component system cell cycle response regulator CtrA